ncbi:hypothetical protein CYMTET_14157, partial [Cymbomonas tetramitiformis]
MSRMYNLYKDKTYGALFKRKNSYKQVDEKGLPAYKELSKRVFAVHNTFTGVSALLSNCYTMIQLQASIETDSTTHSGAEALQAKLAFIEQKVYTGTDGLVADSVLTKGLNDFDNMKVKAVTNTHAKASTFRDRQGGQGKGGWRSWK